MSGPVGPVRHGDHMNPQDDPWLATMTCRGRRVHAARIVRNDAGRATGYQARCGRPTQVSFGLWARVDEDVITCETCDEAMRADRAAS